MSILQIPTFFWVNLNKLLEEYDGLLFLSKTALQARLKKYELMGLLDRKCVKNEKGSFSFFKLTGIRLLLKKDIKKVVDETEDKVVEEIIQATGVTNHEAKKELNEAKDKCDNKRNSAYRKYAIASIKNKRSSKTSEISKNKFINFSQRNYTRQDFINIEKLLLSKQFNEAERYSEVE